MPNISFETEAMPCVSGNRILCNVGGSRGGAAVPGPLLDLGQLVDEEDAFALSLSTGLHDPRAGRVLAELLHKEVIVGGEHERHGDKICTKHTSQAVTQHSKACVSLLRFPRQPDGFTQINIFPVLVLLRQRTTLLLQLLAVALDILDHQVFPGQLVVVGEVVDHLVV